MSAHINPQHLDALIAELRTARLDRMQRVQQGSTPIAAIDTQQLQHVLADLQEMQRSGRTLQGRKLRKQQLADLTEQITLAENELKTREQRP